MFKKIKIYIFKFYHSFQMKHFFIMKNYFVGVVYFFNLLTIFRALRIIFENFSGFFRLKKMIIFSHLRKVDERFEKFQKIRPSKKNSRSTPASLCLCKLLRFFQNALILHSKFFACVFGDFGGLMTSFLCHLRPISLLLRRELRHIET